MANKHPLSTRFRGQQNMMSNAPSASTEKPSILSFNKSTLVIWVAISLIVVETFSGALRYYFDMAGISALLYLPKMGCAVLFALELLTLKTSRLFWIGLLLLLLSSQLALLHGASLNNVGFSLFAISPFLFAMVCSEHLINQKSLLGKCVALCLVASVVGLLLDKYTTVPWKGYTYQLGSIELSANRAWTADDIDRLAGFARVSNVLSIMIAIFSLYLLMFIRSRLLFATVCVVAFFSILLTTSKTPTVAFLFTLGLLALIRYRWTSAWIFVIAVSMGVILPAMGVIHDFDPNAASGNSEGGLASFYDRLVNTWPHLIILIANEGWSWLGVGFGMFGSAVFVSPVPHADMLGTSDNTAVYLWAIFGFAGVFLYMLQLPLLFLLRDYSTTRMDRALLAVTFCICVISWTTDMFEVTLSNLFLGLAIGHTLNRTLSPQDNASPALALTPPLDTLSSALPDQR
jgi:hypothetical protein